MKKFKAYYQASATDYVTFSDRRKELYSFVTYQPISDEVDIRPLVIIQEETPQGKSLCNCIEEVSKQIKKLEGFNSDDDVIWLEKNKDASYHIIMKPSQFPSWSMPQSLDDILTSLKITPSGMSPT